MIYKLDITASGVPKKRSCSSKEYNKAFVPMEV